MLPCVCFQNALLEVQYRYSFYSALFSTGYHAFVAVHCATNTICGVVTGRDYTYQQADDILYWCLHLCDCFDCSPRTAYVMSLCVHPDWQRKGIARRLMDVSFNHSLFSIVWHNGACFAWQRILEAFGNNGVTDVGLHCLCSNDAAKSLYLVGA